MQYELTNFCEIDKNAITSYCRIHNETPDKNLGDISEVKKEDIADCNVVVGGSPCFTKDTLVLTQHGYTPISDVKIGDMVLTHDNTYQKVTNILCQGEKQIVRVKSAYFTDIETTDNHRFYACDEGGQPRWIEVKDLTRSHYVGCYIGETKEAIDATEGELYVYGLYLRCGTKFTPSSLTFKIPLEYKESMNKKLHKYKLFTSLRLDANDAYFTVYFGKYTFLPNFMKLSIEQSKIIWAGFSEFLEPNCYQIKVRDIAIAYEMSYLYMKCYKKACAMQKTEDGYLLDWGAKISNWYVQDNYIWFPFYAENTSTVKEVFDLTVENAHSFVTQHCTVHNCTDFSVAGKRKGAAWTCSDCGHKHNPLEVHYTKRGTCPVCGSSHLEKTCSSLIVEYLRMIREKKPNFAVYENVKNIIGKEFKTLFNVFLDELHEYGYNTYYQVLNAKHFGIPQNRERVILVIIKKELDNGQFKFPETFDSGVRLIHVLEKSVDKKYYVNNEKAEELLRTLSKDAVENISNTGSPIFLDVKHAIENAIENQSEEAVQNQFCVACRGRYKENPNLRISGLPTEQRLEPNLNGTVNTLTSVQKDNLVMEQEIVVDNSAEKHDGWDKNSIDIKMPPELENIHVYANCCIRRLTPLECYRLMGFSDEDFYKAQKGNTIMSDTALYKQAGNSIVTNVLYYTYVELYKAMPYLFDDVKLLSLFSGIGAFEKAFYMLKKYIDDPTYVPNDYRTIIAENKPVRIGQVSSAGSQAGTVYSDKNIAPTICAGTHGYAIGYICTENFTKPPMS